jgi:hypothetical protein
LQTNTYLELMLNITSALDGISNVVSYMETFGEQQLPAGTQLQRIQRCC